MQGGSGQNAFSGMVGLDKSRVLDVKPIRSLKPIFPDANNNPPFVCFPPNGPFPSGYSPFYPFSVPHNVSSAPEPGSNWTPSNPAPIRAFKTPETKIINGDGHVPKKRGRKPSSQKSSSAFSRKKGRKVKSVVGGNFVSPITPSQRENGNREIVQYVMTAYDGLRRKLSQLEDSDEVPATGIMRRANLNASNILMTKGVRTNLKKRIGPIPGIEIGDIFFFRMEMCMVGLHAPSMGGIDYINVRGDKDDDSFAVSIVSSGYYDDDTEDKDVLIYSGQGGGITATNDQQTSDQKLERGNLALERSSRRGNEIRVIRGMRDAVNPHTKVYVYDGLYIIERSWTEKAKSGANTFKFKLVRVPGQPEAFAVWKSIEKWKLGQASRPGVILPDLTSGAESIPVSLVNDIDDEKGPSYFTYSATLKYSKAVEGTHPSYGCNCSDACDPGNLNCACIRKNSGDFPYTINGVLVSQKPVIYECGPGCQCSLKCKNKMSQSGLKIRLEVFKTKDRRWGLRACDPIRAGTFICEYAGEVIEKERLRQKVEGGDNDEYIFDSSRVREPLHWNCEPSLLEEESSNDSPEDGIVPPPLTITAKDVGNVARFMNHSCQPNVFWQPVMYDGNNESSVHIAFYAIRHIPPLTELTYDYGVVPDESGRHGASYRKRKCLCGSAKCRGYFGM